MIYLDNAATSFPKPRAVLDAMEQCLQNYCGNPGRSGHRMSMRTGEEVYRTRKAAAALLGAADAERLLFFQNTTAALNQAIKGVLLPGDSVVTTPMEHNSILRPLKALEYQDVETVFADAEPDGTVSADSVLSKISDTTRLVVCAHACNTTGGILPIEEIGAGIAEINKKRAETAGRLPRPVLFLVDAAQSAGSVPIDVEAMNADMLAAPGHKGLLGPQGTGLLYVRPGLDLLPLTQGGTGTSSKLLEVPPIAPEAFEAGTINAPGIIALGGSIDFLSKIGIPAIADYEDSLVTPLEEALRNMDGVTVYGAEAQKKTPVVMFNIEGLQCEEAAHLLDTEYDIAVRSGFHCAPLAHKTLGTYESGAIRASAGPFNTIHHIQALIDAVHKLSKS